MIRSALREARYGLPMYRFPPPGSASTLYPRVFKHASIPASLGAVFAQDSGRLCTGNSLGPKWSPVACQRRASSRRSGHFCADVGSPITTRRHRRTTGSLLRRRRSTWPPRTSPCCSGRLGEMVAVIPPSPCISSCRSYVHMAVISNSAGRRRVTAAR
ncbi:hypothetical protein AHiyo1_14970 [Arthrobacter sp. Hiyo1]|nr:hypothetical protein AHiyo1_14970 [Arthrobacter sp. Hiyo1]